MRGPRERRSARSGSSRALRVGGASAAAIATAAPLLAGLAPVAAPARLSGNGGRGRLRLGQRIARRQIDEDVLEAEAPAGQAEQDPPAGDREPEHILSDVS